MKPQLALANIVRSTALAAMTLTILASLHGGAEMIYAVLRGMVVFLIANWTLGAAAEVVALTDAKRSLSDDSAAEIAETTPPSPLSER